MTLAARADLAGLGSNEGIVTWTPPTDLPRDEPVPAAPAYPMTQPLGQPIAQPSRAVGLWLAFSSVLLAASLWVAFKRSQSGSEQPEEREFPAWTRQARLAFLTPFVKLAPMKSWSEFK